MSGQRVGEFTATRVLSTAVARGLGEDTIRFLARLCGYPACDRCGFVVDHCRCEDHERAYLAGVTWQGEGLA